MRRSDEEFKKELLLRVEEYKTRQRKRRENVLRAASVAVMVCVLALSSQWGKIADEDWYQPTDRSEAEETKESQEVTEGETEPNQEATEVPTGITGLSGISILEQENHFNSSEAGGSSNGTKNYRDEELAETLLKFLTERIKAAKEIAENSTSVEKPESENPSAGGDSSNASLGKKCRITIHYADGRAIAYQVAEGNGELEIKGGRLILDPESWEQLMRIVGKDLEN